MHARFPLLLRGKEVSSGNVLLPGMRNVSEINLRLRKYVTLLSPFMPQKIMDRCRWFLTEDAA